jgi:hypothetical protein
MTSYSRVSFRFNPSDERLAREQLARKVETLTTGVTLHITCNVKPNYLGLLSFPTSDESAWFRSDIKYFFISSPEHPDEWAREWEEQEKSLRLQYV